MRQTKKTSEKQEDEVDLQVAVMVGDMKGVKKYIDQGGDVDIPDEDGATPIFHAACWNHVEIMKVLISAGANLYVQRNDGFTALHVAAKNNQPKIAEVLVEAMDDLGVQEEFGDTALHCAYRSKATEVVETLLAAGADSETLNHMGDTPRQCEGTGVDRQAQLEDYDDDENDERQSSAEYHTPRADGNTAGWGKRDSRSSPRRPSGGRSTAANTSPRTTRNRSGHDDGGDHGRTASMAGSDLARANFRVAYPPTIRGGGEWQAMTAYLFEPSAHQAVRHAHRACVNGDQSHAFVPSDEFDAVESCDKAIPAGTQVVVRPRFSQACSVSPVMATVEWTKDAHAVPFELRPPADVASGGLVSGCVEIFVGPVLIGQAPVEMVVGEPSDGLDDASEKSSVLGPVTKAFDKLYVCFAAADEALLLPSLERFKRLGIANVTWRLERDDGKEQHDAKKLIRDCAAFQICWSMSAKRNDRVREEIRYAASLVKAGKMMVRGICWHPSLDATSIQFGQALVFPVRLHDSFLLEDLQLFRERADGAVFFSPDNELGAEGDDHDGAMEPAPEVEKLCTPAVEHTRGHVSRLRGMVDGADVVDVPRIVWIHPDDSAGKPGSIDIKTDEWLKKTMRVNFLCPVSMKPGRCGDDGKGYKMSFPRGWSSKIGSSLKIGVVVVAAASDAGEVPGLPAPSAEAVAAWAEEGGGARPTAAEMQADLVNAAFDALAGVVPDKLNDMVDSAFMDAETEGDSAPPASAQLRKETKQSYANLRSLLQKYDKGLQKTGLVKVTHQESGGAATTEWVHPSVAELFRKKGPAIFDRKALADADAEAAQEAAARHRAAMMQKRRASGGGKGGMRSSHHDHQGKENGLDVMSTLRTLENQVLALVEGAGHVAGAGGA